LAFNTFDELLTHAQTANLKVAVLTGAFNNLTGTVAGVTDKMLVLTAEGPTDIYIDRTKIFGMFLVGNDP
jgi:hypothetical protein